MSAIAAPSAAPASALRIWCDARWIYAELPSSPTAERVCVMTFSRDAKGLAKALNLIFGHADNSGSMPENFHAAPEKLPGTPTQHAQAQALLRRRGIIK
jgi:hypothetical protein